MRGRIDDPRGAVLLPKCNAQRGWRRESESNRRPRLCRPLHDHSAIPPRDLTKKGRPTAPSLSETGAGNESRTRDLNLGKVALYQLSYSREAGDYINRLPRHGAAPG